MKVLITGVTSFIGLYTAKQLLADGHHVIGIVRPGSRNMHKLEKFGLTTEETDGRFQRVLMDFDDLPQPETGEPHYRATARTVIEENAGPVINAWIHLSWDGEGSEGRSNIDLQIQNVENAKKAYLMARLLGASKFIFSGSQAEYGRGNHRSPKPVSPYGKGKKAFGQWALEQSLLDELTEKIPMQFIHTRIFSVYGYGDHEGSLVNTVIRGTLKGESIELGSCTQRWNYLEVRDLARALSLLVSTEDSQTDVYDIASGDTRRLKDYVYTIHELAGGKGQLEFGKRSDNAEGDVDLMPANLKMQRLGFHPEISFESGIGELIRKSHG